MTFPMLNININLGLTPELRAVLVGVLGRILANTEKIMATLDEVIADVTEETTTIGSLSTLIQGLRDQIANAGLSPADQAKVDQIFAAVEANKAALASALSANVPAPSA